MVRKFDEANDQHRVTSLYLKDTTLYADEDCTELLTDDEQDEIIRLIPLGRVVIISDTDYMRPTSCKIDGSSVSVGDNAYTFNIKE